MFVAPKVLAGKRVLIVEDELIIAMTIEDFLLECGCIIVGPCSTVAQAMDAVRVETPDLAVLDVNLGGQTAYPVAFALAERHIPFVFTSGYGDQAIPPGHDDWKVCAKPFTGDELIAMLAAALSGGSQTPLETSGP
jgi:CheY-like chemotaxis protein